MHFTKISAIVAHVGLTAASVLAGGEEMGRRQDWKLAKAEALQAASHAQARAGKIAAQSDARAPAAMVTPAPGADKRTPSDWQDQRAAAKQAAAGFRNSQNQNQKRHDEAMVAAPAMPGNEVHNGVNNGQKNWQDDAASAQSLGSSYASWGSSVGASYASQYGASNYGGDWQTAAASAQSLASSYRSEYAPTATATAMATPTPAPSNWNWNGNGSGNEGAGMGGSMGTVGAGAGVVATPTANMVQVNGAVDGAGVVKAKVLGAGAVAMVVAAGML